MKIALISLPLIGYLVVPQIVAAVALLQSVAASLASLGF